MYFSRSSDGKPFLEVTPKKKQTNKYMSVKQRAKTKSRGLRCYDLKR